MFLFFVTHYSLCRRLRDVHEHPVLAAPPYDVSEAAGHPLAQLARPHRQEQAAGIEVRDEIEVRYGIEVRDGIELRDGIAVRD